MNRHIKGFVFETLCRLLAATTCVVLVAILGMLAAKGIGVLSIDFLIGVPAEGMTEGGIFPAIFGTVLMVILMSLAVVPFGVVAAIYLREYAREGLLGDERHWPNGFVVLAVARQQEERAGQPFLAGVEQLVDQILLEPDVAREHVRDKPIRHLSLPV